MDELVTTILDRLTDRTRTKRPFLIAVDGAGGAGKSTFAVRLVARLGENGISAEVVHMDDFYLPSGQRPSSSPRSLEGVDEQQIGADFDWKRLRDQVLVPLTCGQGATYQRYDWQADALSEWHTLASKPVIIVEGVYVLRRELLSFYDLTVWVDCPRAIRLARGIARDGENARALWQDLWMPQEDLYVAAHQPHLAADWVYAGGDSHIANPVTTH
jgi:uridine kinase